MVDVGLTAGETASKTVFSLDIFSTFLSLIKLKNSIFSIRILVNGLGETLVTSCQMKNSNENCLQVRQSDG